MSIFLKGANSSIIIVIYDAGRWKYGVMAMDDMLKGIGDRVRQARANKHMSQMDLAEAAGLSTSFISNVEMGRQGMNIRALISISGLPG